MTSDFLRVEKENSARSTVKTPKQHSISGLSAIGCLIHRLFLLTLCSQCSWHVGRRGTVSVVGTDPAF